MLWKKLEADDFETDIIEVLRESSKELQKLLEGLSREDFSEVIPFLCSVSELLSFCFWLWIDSRFESRRRHAVHP